MSSSKFNLWASGMILVMVAAATVVSTTVWMEGHQLFAEDAKDLGAISSDTSPAYILARYSAPEDGSAYNFSLAPTPYSEFFGVLEGTGCLMTVCKIGRLVGKVVNLRVVEKADNLTVEHDLAVHVLEKSSMLRFTSSEYTGRISENVEALSKVHGAFIKVIGLTAQGKYSARIISGNIGDAFQVYPCQFLPVGKRGRHSLHLCLYTNQALDRESIARYDLVVEVTNGRGLDRATTKVIVEVLDQNDNNPIFEQKVYRYFVDNRTMKKTQLYFERTGVRKLPVVGRVHAWDADGDAVWYKTVKGGHHAVVVPQTGEILLAKNFTDLSVGDEVELEVSAHDHRGRSSPENVHVFLVRGTLDSEEDAYRRYMNFFYRVRSRQRRANNANAANANKVAVVGAGATTGVTPGAIEDPSKLGMTIRSPKFIDLPESDGQQEGRTVFMLEKENPREVFAISDPSNPWVVVDPSGAVKVKKKWDYEELGGDHKIDFWVLITNPSNRDTDTQRVAITLTDVNDEPPYFINRPLPMQAVVPLNAPPNTPIFTLQARDPDTNAVIRYHAVRDRTGGRFEVDERTGVVRTKGVDPFSLDMEFALYVRAEDINGPVAASGDKKSYQTTSEERLSIVAGKRPPQFYMQNYEAEIPENQKKDSDIISVKAKSFADREIRYTLKEQGAGLGTFNIGPTSGIVKLAKELDFEDLRQPHVYSLIVTATEDSGGFSTSVDLTIRVTDVNDNAPKFELPDYQAHAIDEDIPLGTSILRVKAVDADSGSNAELDYRVSNDNFAIDAGGIVSNNKQLDADNNNAYYEFLITAKDRGDPPQTGTATVRIYTRNKNDEEPKFSQQVYTPNVDENAGPNTLVTTVVASDKDGDHVKFGFVGGGITSGQFVIEEVTGVIRLHSEGITLDRDKYELNVTAVDDGACCPNGDKTIHTSTAVVVVFITDVNDNKPVFKDCAKYNPTIKEGANNGVDVIKVTATDEDKGVNGQVKYSIVQQPNQKGPKFTVEEESGMIKSNKVFDREGEDGKFVSVTVKATDQGDPSLEGVCSFTVEITDINDNPPLFDRQKYIENVKQDAGIGTNILRVSASDEDADNNGAIVYSLSAPEQNGDLEYFEIQPESGWIVLRKPLDRESYRLEVMAQDKGYPPLSRTVEVKIEVVDRANNPPVWDHTLYGPVFIKENVSVGAKVVSIKARSGIEGNPFVFYRLMPGSTAHTNKLHTFYLQQRPENGFTWADIKVNQPLDYEQIKEYNLTVRVENNGAQQLATEATVYIIIEDVNDEIPLFTEREQETVLEGEPIGTKVTQVNAIDKDGTSPFNQVFYYVVNSTRNEGKDYFEINKNTGEIFTKVVFDRERQGAYALEIEARDGAPSARPNSDSDPNSVTKFIRIGIADKNDNPPYFDKDLYEAEVDENEDIQHTVLTVTAKDHDESSRIRYEITSGNFGGAFAVKNMTGAIYVAGALDYESKKRYELTLVASDSLNECSTSIVIHVNDVNDLPPVFTSGLYSAVMDEELKGPYPYKLLQVHANDGDIDRPPNIVYFLTGQGIDPDNPANNKFEINRTSGEIFVLKPLDRDHPNGRPQWRFTVFAQDEGGEGLVGYADVQVNLKDVNDNPPIFLQKLYYGNITENGTAGMVVMTMNAVDYDDPTEGSNARLMYSIDKNVISDDTGNSIFEIEPETGVIKTAVCCLDREKTPEYTIQIVATDGGQLKGTGTAVIRVKDINDMPPKFAKEEWYAEVDETDGFDLQETPVLTVTVNDEDETNKFQYKVLENSGYGADKFTMVRNSDGTGSLKVVQPLDFEDNMQSNGFRFRIQVNDKGEDTDTDKYHVAYSWVVVKLKDINDNKPQFAKTLLEASVDENVAVGTALQHFTATDPDQGGKGKITYKIDRASDRRRQFAINQDGVVSVQRNLDREENPRHQVKILAMDDGVPRRTSTATLSVVVLDINDNAPRFLKDYRPVLYEHSPPRKLTEVMATDDDDRSKGNGPVFMFRIDPDADESVRARFNVRSDPKGDNGDGMAIVSSLGGSFDREQKKEWLIPIVIRDSGTPQMTSTCTLTVVIGDLNDNKMIGASKEVEVFTYEYLAPESEIARVYVHDLDDWDLPDKTFDWAVKSDSDHPLFSLNKQTGMISMKKGVQAGEYFLRFKVDDRKHSQSDVMSNVTVRVREITREQIMKSGSIRITGVSDEDFIRIWHWQSMTVSKSKAYRFKENVAKYLNTKIENIVIFSVQTRRQWPPVTDVRFYASTNDGLLIDPIKLNGMIALHQVEIEQQTGMSITMIGIDECQQEEIGSCDGSCTNTLDISPLPHMVNANMTALVGVRVDVIPVCVCATQNFTETPERCHPEFCLNGGRCLQKGDIAICKCSPGYTGYRCQNPARSFFGDGFAWLPPIATCSNVHLSLQFVTRRTDGMLLYNGPMSVPNSTIPAYSDFIMLELDKGQPRLLINYGSGATEIRIPNKKPLDDGEWHTIDVLWDTETVRMLVDRCESAEVVEDESQDESDINLTSCEGKAAVKLFSEYLNVNTPLQIGGMYAEENLQFANYNWTFTPTGKYFEGCIRNLHVNGMLYDLGNPVYEKNSRPGCTHTEDACRVPEMAFRCGGHSSCVSGMGEPRCECDPGWGGQGCTMATPAITFKPDSHISYILSFDINPFITDFQLRFRTRQVNAEILRMVDKHTREYTILGIRDRKLCLRYDLNAVKTEETELCLNFVNVNDGHWHFVKVQRFGSGSTIQLDGGDGRRLNVSLSFKGHQLALVEKHEGVMFGGKPDVNSQKSVEVVGFGCMDDIRIQGKPFLMPNVGNGSQWATPSTFSNIENGCLSLATCKDHHCNPPLICSDIWNAVECGCQAGSRLIHDECVTDFNCMTEPCANDASCIEVADEGVGYICDCAPGFVGKNCDVKVTDGIPSASVDIILLLICLLVTASLLVAVLYAIIQAIRKGREVVKVKYASAVHGGNDDDIRENIISYDDEGGGEDDTTTFDIGTLRIPIEGCDSDSPEPYVENIGTLPRAASVSISMDKKCKEASVTVLDPAIQAELTKRIAVNVSLFIDEHKDIIDVEGNFPPFDDHRSYIFEGTGSTSGSLSSLASGTDDESQDYTYVGKWGPRFDKIASMYSAPRRPTTLQSSDDEDSNDDDY